MIKKAELYKLLTLLNNKTESDKIKWIKSNNYYKVIIDDLIFKIRCNRDKNNDYNYIFCIINKDDNIMVDHIFSSINSTPEHTYFYADLKKLFHNANNSTDEFKDQFKNVLSTLKKL